MTLPPNPLWDFAVRLYRRNEVAAACLTLQERYAPEVDVDVNVILWCVWTALGGHGELDEQTLAGALAVVADWRREVILPLRAARRRLLTEIKPVPLTMAESLRQDIGHAELEAERIELLVLAQIVPGRERSPPPATAVLAAQHNLTHYFERLNLRPDAADQANFTRILGEALGRTPGPGPA